MSKIDSDPDPLVSALQNADAHLIAARLELRPVLIFAEQRQRMRDRQREAKAAQNESTPPLERKGA
jgi:hypothetical protein